MPLELEQIPTAPHLVPVFKPTLAGVDFLNLRQVNLDLMGQSIPGTNNATKRIRAYSLIAWVYWIYPRILEKQNRTEANSEELILFREKVESLFVWGHQLSGLAGMPGITAKPPTPRDSKVDLSFKAWKRSQATTSLQAAVQYGPSLLDLGGLGLLHKVGPGVYACNAAGEKLARALDLELRRSPAYDFLVDIGQLEGTEEQALALLPHWRFEETSPAEAEAFRDLLWDPAHTDEKSPRGRRAGMIELILGALNSAGEPLSVEEIRRRIALPERWGSEPLSDGLLRQSRTWLVLQIRQLQRLAIESLMSWLESQLLQRGHQVPDALVAGALEAIEERLGYEPNESTTTVLGKISDPILTIDGFSKLALGDPEWFCPWSLCEGLAAAVKADGDECLTTAIYSLLLLNQFRPFLEGDELLKCHLEHGGATRQSLAQWFSIVDRLRDQPFRQLIDWTLKNLVISQHIAVGTQRFDGKKIRLRMILEEDGLETLVRSPWRPGLTPDRLAALLSLLTGSHVLVDSDGRYSLAS